MKSSFFSIASCFSLGLLLSNLTYLVPTHFWLFAVAGFVIVIAMCFPGTAELLRRWSAVAIVCGAFANNWEILGKMSAIQWVAAVVAIVLVIVMVVAIIGVIPGGQDG